MKYLSELSLKRLFNYEYMLSLTGNRALANQTIQNYLKKGYIRRIKKNLYGVASLENQGLIANKFEIASAVNDACFISYHSALEYYGYANQVYQEVYISSLKQFRDFDFENIRYVYKYTNNNQLIEINLDVKVTSIERTIIDLIDSIKSYEDIEELIKGLTMIPILNEHDILAYLENVNKKVLYNKVGHLLSHFKERVFLSEQFFSTLKNKGTKTRKYIIKKHNELVEYDKVWKLYSFNIAKMIGGDLDV
ncbi:MAG: hypothetical protein K8Q99_06625 [Acholeplasmataceae bacterium]|nr:hypothetical protein [Acholeplasmataceae bacterium]